MKSKRVGIVMGGTSAERSVSLASGHAVADALFEAGYTVVPVDLDGEKNPLLELSQARIDVAFLALHGRLGEDGCIQGMLEWLGIPYTGSSVLGSALCLDKLKAKELLRLHNLPTAPYYEYAGSLSRDQILEAHGSFGYPVVVKPRREGSSIGLSRATNPEELVTAMDKGLACDDSVVVERYVRGKEITVGVLDGRVLGALEIETQSGLYDYEAKYTPGATRYHVPARLPSALYRNVLFLAERAVGALGVTGAARVDLIVTENQNEYVLEVNTLPGMTATSLLPRIAEAAGYGFLELCEAILAGARLHVGRAARPSTAQLIPMVQPTQSPLRVAVG
jgi:D-alanine-D-alanine ligase